MTLPSSSTPLVCNLWYRIYWEKSIQCEYASQMYKNVYELLILMVLVMIRIVHSLKCLETGLSAIISKKNLSNGHGNFSRLWIGLVSIQKCFLSLFLLVMKILLVMRRQYKSGKIFGQKIDLILVMRELLGSQLRIIGGQQDQPVHVVLIQRYFIG